VQRAEREREAAARAQAEAQRVAEERAEAERAAAALAAALAPKDAAQTLVMVVDDSKVVRIKTGRLLAQHQYQVSYAADGLEALQLLQTQCPDIVITDVEMPGLDGFELTRHIRADARTAHIPVIMITAADDRHREQADAVGVSVLLGKPYPEDVLVAHIAEAMQAPALA
jgi:CheY-like chemotaxis protein